MEKSGIRKPVQLTILGFGFVPTYIKGEKGKYQMVVGKKRWQSLKQKLKVITRKTTPMTFDERIRKIIEVQGGLRVLPYGKNIRKAQEHWWMAKN